MLKSLTAKAVCDALVDLFALVGVPSVIVSDRGTNFTSQLTQEMLKCAHGRHRHFKIWHQKTRIVGLPDGKEIMTLPYLSSF